MRRYVLPFCLLITSVAGLVVGLGVGIQPPRIAHAQVVQPVVVDPALPAAAPQFMPTSTTNRVWVPGIRKFAHFTPRHALRGSYRLKRHAAAPAAWPQPASLPSGYTSVNNAIIPIDDNDSLGICGPAMGAHSDNVLTFRATGTASVITNNTAFVNQYESVSGGDNGTSEPEMTDQIWSMPAGISGMTWSVKSPASTAAILGHIDLPVDPNVVRGAIYTQGVVCMAFSVPNAWINSFNPSNPNIVWDAGHPPNPMNGHFVPLVGTLANGNFVLLTWGGSVQLTPAGLKACEAELFTVFTARAYNPATGLDFNGRDYATNAGFWASMGGGPLPPSPFAPTPPPVPPVAGDVVTVDYTHKTVSGRGWRIEPNTNPMVVGLHNKSRVAFVPGPGWSFKPAAALEVPSKRSP